MAVEIPRGKRRPVIAVAAVGPTRGLPPALFYHDITVPITGGVTPMSCCTVLFSAEHLYPEPIPLARRMLLTAGDSGCHRGSVHRRTGNGGLKDHPHRLLQPIAVCPAIYGRSGPAGSFKAEGLDVEIVNLRGSPAVIQALAGGAIEYGASTFEDVLAAAEHGVLLTRFISTSELPLSALAVAPTLAGEITRLCNSKAAPLAWSR